MGGGEGTATRRERGPQLVINAARVVDRVSDVGPNLGDCGALLPSDADTITVRAPHERRRGDR
jgi:hypothetical protein